MHATRSGSKARWLSATGIAAVVAFVVPQAAASAGVTNPDLDQTFGTAGRAATTFPGAAGAVDLAFTRGRILVAGTVGTQHGNDKIALARYGPNGHLDTAFGNQGRAIVAFKDHDVQADALLAFSSGRFVVGATLDPNGPGEATFALVGFKQNGTLDTGFGDGGRAVADLPSGSWFLSSLTRQVDGNLLAAGWRAKGVVSNFALVRFMPNGSLDGSYGTGGHVVIGFPAGPGIRTESAANGLTLDVAGRAVAVGWTTSDDCHFRWALARFQPNGTLDTSFGGGDGKVTTEFANNDARASAVAFGDDNTLTVVGTNHSVGCGGEAQPTTGTAAVARYLSGGALDSTFGGDGRVSTTFLRTKNSAPVYRDFTLEEGGQIAATGAADVPKENRSLVIVGEYLRDGSLNTTFSGDGRASARGPYAHSSARGLFEDPNGRPTVAGASSGPGNPSLFLVERFKASGAG
jgi:uncharacterized delta-60 repeat protein